MASLLNSFIDIAVQKISTINTLKPFAKWGVGGTISECIDTYLINFFKTF